MALDQTVKPHKHMRLLQFDNKYLIPLLTNLCQYGSSSYSPDRPGRKSFSDEHSDEDAADGDEVIEVVRRETSPLNGH